MRKFSVVFATWWLYFSGQSINIAFSTTNIAPPGGEVNVRKNNFLDIFILVVSRPKKSDRYSAFYVRFTLKKSSGKYPLSNSYGPASKIWWPYWCFLSIRICKIWTPIFFRFKSGATGFTMTYKRRIEIQRKLKIL